MRGVAPMILLAGAVLCACPGPKYLSRAQMLDPQNCAVCHVDHFNDWAGSMHAYASVDPVFLAMNQRGQRETGGQLGTFCVNCHAPMAVHEGATTDGLNLDSVPGALKGVTCFFCHSVDEVDGGHNNPLVLASDLVMRGEYSDPLKNTAHASAHGDLLDRDQLASGSMCGSCHDIVNGHGTSIERTFEEWQGSVFGLPPGGATCSQCHMPESSFTKPIAQFQDAPPRYFHAHTFPGVDVALAPSVARDQQSQLIQAFLDNTLQSAVCVSELTPSVKVILDNVGAGHRWPSGSSQDRRAWVQVVAYLDGGILYQSGVVPDGGEVTALNDPDLWLFRDSMVDPAGRPVDMFWQAAGEACNSLPVLVTFNTADPRFYQTHVVQTYPSTGLLAAMPDRVTARVFIQPIGLDVLDDLIDSGDLDAGYKSQMPVFTVGRTSTLEWTSTSPDAGEYFDSVTQQKVSCVTQTSMNLQANKVPAPKQTGCVSDGG